MHDNEILHVLFVEDSEDDKELLLNALAGAFADIRHARVESSAALREALSRQAWDVIICDHHLPALDAPTALRIAQECGCDAPFIIASGDMEDQDVAAVMTAGAADMISKTHLSRLAPAVQRELRKLSTMSDLRKARAHLRQIAYYDRLTGLPNRDFVAAKVQRLTAKAGFVDTLALMVVNLNRFSLIARTLGIAAADHTLRAVGERLRKSVGSDGLVASLGGDRFAVLVTNATVCPEDVIERMNEAVARPLKIAGQELFLGQRIGIAMYPGDGRDFHKLVVNAEIAMSLVHAGSRPNYRFFDHGMNAAGQERLMLEHALHRALKRNEFVLHYQPQYDVASGRIVGVEALLRWQPPGQAHVSPAHFIPLLEETGLIVPVGEWVLRTACEDNLQWQRAGYPPVKVAVNLSAIQFQQNELVPTVRRVLNETGLDRRCLELEITENVAMHNEETVISTLAELHDMGVSLAIDDFGTGYSSLSYLQRFPVHKLKIDRSFVNDIATTGGSIAKAIISLAHNLSLDVIAEGVETHKQSAFLQSCGCTEMQGYLFGKPMPREDIAQVLAREMSAQLPDA